MDLVSARRGARDAGSWVRSAVRHPGYAGSGPMKDLIIQAFNNVIDRKLAEEAEVSEKIKQRGT